jgi:hypothetical protein
LLSPVKWAGGKLEPRFYALSTPFESYKNGLAKPVLLKNKAIRKKAKSGNAQIWLNFRAGVPCTAGNAA